MSFRSVLACSVAIAASAFAITAHASDLASVRAAGVLKALTTGNDKPNVYMDPSGQPVGFEVDMCNMIAEKLGVKLEIAVLSWEGLLPSITSGRADMICSSVNMNKTRAEAFDFTVPYSRSATIAMVPEGAADSNDLTGKIVGTVIGADGEDVVRAVGGFKEVKVYKGPTEVFADFIAGRIEVAVIGDKQAAEFIKSRPGAAKIVGEPFKVNLVGYPLQKGASDDLKAAIDKIITEARNDGTLKKMAQESFGLDNYDAALPAPGEMPKFD